MISHWTKHLKDPKKKAEFEQYILGSKQLLNRLNDMISEKLEEMDRSETTIDAYNNPNWSSVQAHKNGYRSALKAIRGLVTVDQQKDNK